MAQPDRPYSVNAQAPDVDRSAVSMRWLWPTLLVAVTAVASLAFACVTPFAAIALVAARTLRRRAAFLTIAAVWLANQAVGFAALDYPRDAETLAWGVAIGVAAVASTMAAAALMRRFHAASMALSLIAGFAASFVVFEAVLFATAPILGGTDTFAPAIIGELLLLNGAWAVALIAVHEAWRRAGFSRRLSLRGAPVAR
jgi:hypothetical protein